MGRMVRVIAAICCDAFSSFRGGCVATDCQDQPIQKPEHQESETIYSPFVASPKLQGTRAVLDLPDDLVELIDAKGALWEPMPDLIDRFARADPSLVDMSGVNSTFSAMVTKLLDYKRTRTDPLAKEALRKEGRALADMGTWDESTVQVLEDLLKEVQKTGERIHIGQLLGICSIKYWEMPAALHIYKGSWCFQAPETKYEKGGYALFQELHSKPPTVTACNINIFHGLLLGNKLTIADAVRAYVQAVLKAKSRTFVKLPRGFWPDGWEGKYKNPVVLLAQAIYGTPMLALTGKSILQQC